MALGLSPYAALATLNAIGNGTPFSVLAVYASLHLGDPGPQGTANPATETTRKLVSFGAPALAGDSHTARMLNDVAVVWTAILGSQDPTNYALHDALSGGNHIQNGVLIGSGYTAGQTYTIPIGGLLLWFPVAYS